MIILERKSDACYLTVGSRGRVVPLGASQFGLVIHPARIRCHTDILSHSLGFLSIQPESDVTQIFYHTVRDSYPSKAGSILLGPDITQIYLDIHRFQFMSHGYYPSRESVTRIIDKIGVSG